MIGGRERVLTCHDLLIVGLAWEVVEGVGELCALVVVRGNLNPTFLRTVSSRRSFGQSHTVLLRRARLARAKKVGGNKYINAKEVV